MGDLPEKPPASSNSSRVENEQAGKPKPPHVVLIVEDMVELAEIIQVTLERLNLRVYHATHGTTAIELFHAVHPDLVLLDLALPDITGWKVLDIMREEQHDGKNSTILVTTAYGDPANRLMGRLQGIHGYLIKPLTAQEVETAVLAALKIRKP